MEIKNTLIIISLFSASCSSTPPPDLDEIHKMFNISSGVKEIYTVNTLVTTVGKERSSYKTTFEENGEPIETITYSKNGRIEKAEPWVRAKKGEFENPNIKKEFDTSKRLIRSTTYHNGIITYQVQYKYDEFGNKIEESDKDKRIAYKYFNQLLTEEITFTKAEDNQFYWNSKKKFEYDVRSNLIEMLVYYYPDEKIPSAKYLYKYDPKGSLIETIGYSGKEIIEMTNRKIVYY